MTKYATNLRVIVGFIYVIRVLCTPIFWLLNKFRKAERVPPVTEDVLLLSATKLAAKIRDRELKSEDIVNAYIKRIREVNPLVNGIVQDRFQLALIEAKKCDQIIANGNIITFRKLQLEKPLFGVPVTVKESIAVKDMSYTGCSLSRSKIKASDDADVVRLLKNAGAIIMAVTTTPEFCMSWECQNRLTGCTKNPYNTLRTSGASSAGEGALIGSGASILGIGSDIAGSVRLPAMFCGVFGHKPSSEIVSLHGHMPCSDDEMFQRLLTIGPIARYAEDLRVMLGVVSGDKKKLLNLDEKVDLSDVNVWVVEEFSKSMVRTPVEREIRDLFTSVCHYLKTKQRCKIHTEEIVDLTNAMEMGCAQSNLMLDVPDMFKNPNNIKATVNLNLELIKSLLGLSLFSFNSVLSKILIDKKFYLNDDVATTGVRDLERVKRVLTERLGSNGVLLVPTWPTAAFEHSRSLFNLTAVEYPVLVNALGFPATHVPLGLNKDGLPIGIQVIAPLNQDRVCLAVAEELERGFGGWVRP